jgi:hypothetical protein
MCMTGENITAVGLVLDIIGAVLLWFFVVEINFADKADYLNGNATLNLADPTPQQIKRYKRNIMVSRFAILFLILGFIFQLIGNYVK